MPLFVAKFRCILHVRVYCMCVFAFMPFCAFVCDCMFVLCVIVYALAFV